MGTKDYVIGIMEDAEFDAHEKAMRWAWANGYSKHQGFEYGENHWEEFIEEKHKSLFEEDRSPI